MIIPNPITVPLNVAENPVIPLGVREGSVTMPMELSTAIQTISGNHYEGVYEVTPLADFEVVLETQGLFMDNDVTVNKIPYFETSNEAGGTTVYIGG